MDIGNGLTSVTPGERWGPGAGSLPRYSACHVTSKTLPGSTTDSGTALTSRINHARCTELYCTSAVQFCALHTPNSATVGAPANA